MKTFENTPIKVTRTFQIKDLMIAEVATYFPERREDDPYYEYYAKRIYDNGTTSRFWYCFSSISGAWPEKDLKNYVEHCYYKIDGYENAGV